MKRLFLNAFLYIKKRAISVLLLLLSSTFIFAYGVDLDSTRCQYCAESLSNISIKEDCSPVVSIFDNENTTARFFSNHYHGFYLFHTGYNVFAGYNVDKSKKASLEFNGSAITDAPFNNLTLVTSRGIDVEKNKEGKYRNSYYSFDLMFSSIGKAEGYSTSCFITKTQADKLLSLSNKSSYEDLIGTKVVFNCEDKDPIELTIFNIILEEGDEFARFSNNFGYFFVANDWEFLRKPFLSMNYFMNRNGFENYQYLKMIKEAYSGIDTDNKIINRASSYDEINNLNKSLDSFMKSNNRVRTWSVIFLIASIIFVFSSFLYIYISNKDIAIKDALFYLIIPLLPYIVFRTISFITNSCVLFSYYSTTGLFIIELLLFIFLIILLHLRSRNVYEINR